MDGFMLRVLRPTGDLHGRRKLEPRREQRPRCGKVEQRMEHDYRDVGVRVVPGATTELPRCTEAA